MVAETESEQDEIMEDCLLILSNYIDLRILSRLDLSPLTANSLYCEVGIECVIFFADSVRVYLRRIRKQKWRSSQTTDRDRQQHVQPHVLWPDFLRAHNAVRIFLPAHNSDAPQRNRCVRANANIVLSYSLFAYFQLFALLGECIQREQPLIHVRPEQQSEQIRASLHDHQRNRPPVQQRIHGTVLPRSYQRREPMERECPEPSSRCSRVFEWFAYDPREILCLLRIGVGFFWPDYWKDRIRGNSRRSE